MRVVCEADITCSALKVDDTADADALLEAAAAALTAAGHGEKMAARERRLADCTMSDSMALGFALAIARLTQQWRLLLGTSTSPDNGREFYIEKTGSMGDQCRSWCREGWMIQENCRDDACAGCPECLD